LTYPILKYEKEGKVVMINTQKCPTAWKEGKVVMLPTPCSEEEKNIPGN
jgi:hypothetical protein